MSRNITELPPMAADERVRYGGEPAQFYDVFRTQGETSGAAVMIHGGFWRARYDLRHASHLCSALARVGIVTINLEYRRVGDPGGGWRGTYEDVLAGFDAAREAFGPQIVVLGHSAGGHLALRLAADRAPNGIVALAPVADLQWVHELNLSNGAAVEFLGGTPDVVPDAWEDADPTRHSSAVRRCLIHGELDDVVPISMSQRYLEAREADMPPVVLVKIRDADHFDLIDPESHSAWEAVIGAVRSFL